MDKLTEIMEKLSTLHGVEFGSKSSNEDFQKIQKKNCEWLCERENNTEGNLNEADGYDCRECRNKGYIIYPDMYMNSYQQVQRECKCMRIRRTIRALNRSGLSDVVHDFTLDKYVATEKWQQDVKETALSYLSESDKKWFFFGGATGSGKTHICTAISIKLLKAGNEVKYMLWVDESKRLKSIVNEPEYHEEIRKLKDVDVLYIDDLFKTGKSENQARQRPTTADINLAFEIINARDIQKKVTIISSESTLSDLIDIDEATAGRIKKNCGPYCINIAQDRSKNYRLK